jgi:hypothetical protein
MIKKTSLLNNLNAAGNTGKGQTPSGGVKGPGEIAQKYSKPITDKPGTKTAGPGEIAQKYSKPVNDEAGTLVAGPGEIAQKYSKPANA